MSKCPNYQEKRVVILRFNTQSFLSPDQFRNPFSLHFSASVINIVIQRGHPDQNLGSQKIVLSRLKKRISCSTGGQGQIEAAREQTNAYKKAGEMLSFISHQITSNNQLLPSLPLPSSPSNSSNSTLQSIMTQKKINNYLIQLNQVLGRGSFGSVYLGEQDNTKLTVAVKVLEKATIDHDEYLKAALFSEIQILQLLKSDNVVRVFDVMESNHNYYIIQELCDSDLQHLLADDPKLDQPQARELLRQICNGFLALAKEGIVHRDLKPANLMLKKGVIKIGDFGFAKKNVSNRMKIATSVGTPLYMSPQVLKSQPYTSKCDVWATGFIFYEMLHGKTPWTAHSEFELVKNIETKPLIIENSLSEQAQDFLRRTLALNEMDRMSWDEAFLHPVFEGAFREFAKESQHFQDRLKAVMGELRFQINCKNIDLSRLLQNLGFQGVPQLDYKQFQRFIRHIHQDLTRQEIRFFFEKLDENADGSISIEELALQMEKHHISFSKLSPQVHQGSNFHVKKTQSTQCLEDKRLSSQLQIRVKKCFAKLYRILKDKNITLFRTFQAFDVQHVGSLNVDQFQKILLKMDAGFSRQDVEDVFDYVDLDKSKTIQFSELRTFYCKINGIPETLEDPDFHASASSKQSHEQSHSHKHSSTSHRRKIFQNESSKKQHHQHQHSHHTHEHSHHTHEHSHHHHHEHSRHSQLSEHSQHSHHSHHYHLPAPAPHEN